MFRPVRRGRTVRTMITAVLAVAGTAVAGVAPASAEVRRPVGQASSAPAPRVTVARTMAVGTATCNAVQSFSRLETGPLYRFTDATPLQTTTMVNAGQAGSGWGGFAWIGSGGDGVLYALTTTGDLRWYRYNVGGTTWYTGSGKIIGSGFTPITKVINVAVGANGDLYFVRTTGALVIYRHTGRLTGAATWANSGGYTIGSGWTGSEIIVPNGGGVVYRQVNGNLIWYKHSDPALGAVTWSKASTIGTGWRFYDLLSAGGGVLYATQGQTGQVLLYQHADPSGGTAVWNTARGVPKMVADARSFGITVDPNACSMP